MRCAVKNCNYSNKLKPCKISFFNFPSNAACLKQWKSFCRRDNKMNTKTSQICMEHLKPEDFENNLQYEMGFTKMRFLRIGAVPSIRKASTANEDICKERARRIQKRDNKKIVEILIKEHDSASVLLNENTDQLSVQPEETEVNMECQFKGTKVLLEHQKENSVSIFNKNNEKNDIECLNQEIERLRKENAYLEKATNYELHELHQIFEANNREGLLIGKDFLKSHIEQAQHIDCDKKVKMLFFALECTSK